MNDRITVVNQDCMTLLESMEDESVDMVFADPPFNVGKRYSGVSDRRVDYKEWCAAWISECFRVLKPTGTFYLMTIDRHLEWKFPLMAAKGVFINLIKWRNVSASHDKRRFWNSTQPILVYGKTDAYKYNQYAQRRKNVQTVKGHRSRWGNEPQGQMIDYWDDIPFVYSGSVIHPEAVMKPGTNKKLHPCQMPEMLVGRAIMFSTDEDDIVMDPFTGSGTTPVACEKLKRKFIGCEDSEIHYQEIQDRISKNSNNLFNS